MLTIMLKSRDRCRANAVLPSSVEELAMIVSILMALLYDFEYASVRITRKIKLINSQSITAILDIRMVIVAT